MYNKADTSQPYNEFLSLMAGSLSPKLIMPLPKMKKDKWAWAKALAKMIAIAVVIAAAVTTAGAALGALGLMADATLMGVPFVAVKAVVTGVFAAIGDAAVQGVAVKIGWQDKFSWAEVLETGVSAGVTSSLPKIDNLFSKAGMMSSLEAAAEIGTAAALTQFIEMKTGLRDKFDINAIYVQLSASLVSMGLDALWKSEVVKGVIGDGEFAKGAKTTINTYASAVLGHGITGAPVDVQTIAMNAVGSYIGGTINEKYFSQNPGASDFNQSELSMDALDSYKMDTPRLDVSQNAINAAKSQMPYGGVVLDPGLSTQRSNGNRQKQGSESSTGKITQRLSENSNTRNAVSTPSANTNTRSAAEILVEKAVQQGSDVSADTVASKINGWVQAEKEHYTDLYNDARYGTGWTQAKAIGELALDVASWVPNPMTKGIAGIVRFTKFSKEVGEVEKARTWTTKSRLKTADLPTEGKIRYVPREGYTPSMPLPKGENGGYLDRFGNEWVKGPSRTSGQSFEWDIQLSSTGKKQLGWATRDGSHLNVSLNGKITHK